jgi:two-component system, OmpR family, alkaline phosphatase synthesis response regulator PhoP
VRSELIPSVPTRPRVLKALVIEADKELRQLLRLHLELTGFEIDEASDGRTGLERVRTTGYSLIVLDVDLPGVDGLALCRVIRASGPNLDAGVLLVASRNSESDKVAGFTSGADDYVTKPFGLRELLARVGAIMRRTRRDATQPDHSSFSSATLSLDVARRQAVVRGRRVELTRQEFDVLHQLAARPGTVFSRAMLLRNVWSGDARASERTVDVAISRLRRKIETNPHNPELILTAWGLGYKFAADREIA